MAVGGVGLELRETIRELPQILAGCSDPVGGELRKQPFGTGTGQKRPRSPKTPDATRGVVRSQDGRVIAPSAADVTSATYLAKTPSE